MRQMRLHERGIWNAHNPINLLRSTASSMKNAYRLLPLCALVSGALLLANRATAQNLPPPPSSGLLVFSLTGDPVDTSVDAYAANFIASSVGSDITFVFRHDPGFFFLSNVTVTDLTNPSGNIIGNGDFLADGHTNPGDTVTDWSYFFQTGNDFPQYFGFEDGSGNFVDGSTQAYDGISQAFATTMGDTYQISFDLRQDESGVADYQPTSTNGDTSNTGGNGIDMFVYAGNGIPSQNVPDSGSTLALLAGGIVALALPGLRRIRG
jgi:protein with PEP-CTERM/exosortase system signal